MTTGTTIKKVRHNTTRFKNDQGEWLEVPFRDSNSDVALTCLPEDVEGAVCHSPNDCILARMCKRQWGDLFQDVVILGTVAHIIMLDANDSPFSIRYFMDPKLKKAITIFDGEVELGFMVGQSYTLTKPTRSNGHDPITGLSNRGNRRDRDNKDGPRKGQGPQRAVRKPNSRPLSTAILSMRKGALKVKAA